MLVLGLVLVLVLKIEKEREKRKENKIKRHAEKKTEARPTDQPIIHCPRTCPSLRPYYLTKETASAADKSTGHRISLNRSQCVGCSTTYNTQTEKRVVCQRFHTRTLLLKNQLFDQPSGVHGSGIAVVCRGFTHAPPLSDAYTQPQQRASARYRRDSGRDSDLEAFSHKPAEGSFAPLAPPPST